MDLFYRQFGDGAPIIILHGLYGSSDNWVSIGRQLALDYEVWLVDQRNHGRSSHDKVHTYKEMQNDLLKFMNTHKIEKATLLGHSMGGKTVMQFALNYPERVNHLIVIDIAPKSYLFSLNGTSDTLNHKAIIEAMMALNLDGVKQREQLDGMLSKSIYSARIRQFLLKNIKRKDDGSFSWTLNLNALYENIEVILDDVSFSTSTIGDEIRGFPVLFIKGEKSEYITEDDKENIEGVFPYANFATVANAGHWLHAEQPQLLIESLKEFLR